MSNRPKLPKKLVAPTLQTYTRLSNLHLAKEISRMEAMASDGNATLTKSGRQKRFALRTERQARITDGTW